MLQLICDDRYSENFPKLSPLKKNLCILWFLYSALVLYKHLLFKSFKMQIKSLSHVAVEENSGFIDHTIVFSLGLNVSIKEVTIILII